MNASWKISGIFKADAQKVADEIGEEKVTPELVLERARDENSELHKCFEWDDGIAAEKYRLEQARRIIVNLVVKPKEKDSQPIRCFQVTSERHTYQPTQLFMKQEGEYQKLLKRALRELESFKRRYESLAELETIFEQIDDLLAS